MKKEIKPDLAQLIVNRCEFSTWESLNAWLPVVMARAADLDGVHIPGIAAGVVIAPGMHDGARLRLLSGGRCLARVAMDWTVEAMPLPGATPGVRAWVAEWLANVLTYAAQQPWAAEVESQISRSPQMRAVSEALTGRLQFILTTATVAPEMAELGAPLSGIAAGARAVVTLSGGEILIRLPVAEFHNDLAALEIVASLANNGPVILRGAFPLETGGRFLGIARTPGDVALIVAEQAREALAGTLPAADLLATVPPEKLSCRVL